MKKAAIPVLLALLIAGGWLAWHRHSTAVRNAATPASDLVARVERRNIDFQVEVTGDISPVVQLDVKPEVGGKLKRIHVEPGQDVAAGDPLVEIDDTDLLNEKATAMTTIEGAKLSAEKTRRNFQRARELFENKLISREVFDNLASDLAIAENNLALSQRRLRTVEDRLAKTRIFAASSGTVLSVPVVEGQVVVAAASVNSGTTLMTIADLSRLLVKTHVNQIDIGQLRLNQAVTLSTEALKETVLEANVSFIAPVATVKNSVKGFQVEATIHHPDPRLRPGMTVTMEIPVASAQNALSVPISAVFSDGRDGKVVYVRSGEATEKRAVEVGVSDLQHAEIKTGLRDGEEILLVDPAKLGKPQRPS